jgi:hypothetical protein
MLPILGISGYAGSGKDSAAQYLVSRYGARTVAQAEPLKRMVRDLFLVPEPNLWGPSEARTEELWLYPPDISEIDRFFDKDPYELGLKPEWKAPFVEVVQRWCGDLWAPRLSTARELLQILGTDWGRRQDLLLWTRWATRECTRVLYQPHVNLAVITDIRFRSEIVDLKSRGGSVIRIDRSLADGDFRNHESETAMSEIPLHFYDIIIDNNGTIDDLYYRTAFAADTLITKMPRVLK